MKDLGFRSGERERIRARFTDHVILELPRANHFIQEDAPAEIAEAIAVRLPN
jgi:haloalkane dehalogenase